jgi:hypothetical protein
MEAEAEIQRVKARQAFLDNLAVMVAMTSIVILALVVVILKSVMFPDEKVITFIPLTQQVDSFKWMFSQKSMCEYSFKCQIRSKLRNASLL